MKLSDNRGIKLLSYVRRMHVCNKGHEGKEVN
jgi:hypothetical protein